MTIRARRLISAGLLAMAALPFAWAQAGSAPADAVAPQADTGLPPAAASEEQPVRPPRVVCSGDQLSISANNATLESILILVRGCSGAKIEIPASASRTRAFEDLGPGPIRKVLDDLLSGTEFNYVIQSSEAQPARLESVTLTARKGDTSSGNGSHSIDAPNTELEMTPARKKWLSMQKFDKPDPSNPEQDPRMLAQTSSATADGATSTPLQDAGKPADTTAEAMPPASPAVDNSTSNNPAKATENRITSMQQLFDQRREMIQKQNAAAPPAQSPTPN